MDFFICKDPSSMFVLLQAGKEYLTFWSKTILVLKRLYSFTDNYSLDLDDNFIA
jgi:hypothetical protein